MNSRRRQSRKEIVQILRKVTESMLDQMQEDGWYTSKGDYVHSRPLPWDINNGRCEEWAEAAKDALGRGESDFVEDMDPELYDIAHIVLVLDGRYYDAQVPEGVDSLRDLPIVRRVPRGK